MDMLQNQFEDPHFWAAVSFVILVLAAYKPLSKIIFKGLDSRSDNIRKELDEAQRLKEEAETFLTSCQRRYKEALDEAAQILAHAKEESARMSEEAHANLEANIQKRLDIATQKISNYETAALQEIRIQSVDLAVSAARKLMMNHLDDKTAHILIEHAIADTKKKLH